MSDDEKPTELVMAEEEEEDEEAEAPGGGGDDKGGDSEDAGDAGGGDEEGGAGGEAEDKGEAKGDDMDDLFGSDDEEDTDEKRREKNKMANPLGKGAKKRKADGDKKKKKRRKGGEDEGEKEVWGALIDSEDDEEGERTAADESFIDDQGAAKAHSDDDDDDELPAGYASEAEEAGEEEEEDLEKALKAGKKKKRTMSHEETKELVDSFLSKMEVAAENDMKANREGRPAFHKLKLVKDMKTMLFKVQFQQDFLDQGVLGVLKAWIEPLPDGSLPNLNVRSAVLQVLQQLPVELEHEERRDQLKKSGLGRVVMFLFKLPDETKENRKAAKKLVEKWSRPIFELSTRYEDLRRLEATEGVTRRVMKSSAPVAQESTHEEDGSRKKAMKPGDKGWRWHAAVPQKVPLDYINRPDERISEEEMKDRKREGKNERSVKLSRKLADIKKAKNAGRQAEKLSVEGRGLVHYGN